MTKHLEKAKAIMLDNNLTLAAINEKKTFTSELHGIAPVLSLLRTDKSLLERASVSDRVIGKAAALLFAYGRVSEIYAGIISEPALETLKKHNIYVVFDEKTQFIKNRSGEGLCPMEASVMFVESPERGFEILAGIFQ
ncbi:MAG: DUF1893 domain-containing protein [Eubacterium sp.]|nr:DUF1893 domain-containing protein [Eubacterium sp.]